MYNFDSFLLLLAEVWACGLGVHQAAPSLEWDGLGGGGGASASELFPLSSPCYSALCLQVPDSSHLPSLAWESMCGERGSVAEVLPHDREGCHVLRPTWYELMVWNTLQTLAQLQHVFLSFLFLNLELGTDRGGGGMLSTCAIIEIHLNLYERKRVRDPDKWFSLTRSHSWEGSERGLSPGSQTLVPPQYSA